MTCTTNLFRHRMEGIYIWDTEALVAHTCTCILDAFDLMIFKGLTTACSSKTGGHIRRTDNCDSGGH